MRGIHGHNSVYECDMHRFTVQRCAFALSIGAATTLVLFLVVGNSWVAVFLIGSCLGFLVSDNWELRGCVDSVRSDEVELEKQVISLRSTMSEMAAHSVDSRPKAQMNQYCNWSTFYGVPVKRIKRIKKCESSP